MTRAAMQAPSTEQPPAGSARGLIPAVVRVGVTGHRTLTDVEGLRAAVDQAVDVALGSLLSTSPREQPRLVVVSALAEGADRFLARELIERFGAELETALPLPPADYVRDFATPESAAEFELLLARSRTVWQAAEAESRNAAYADAGVYIVDHCDVLLALWDGEAPRGTGGTAWVLEYARQRGVPIAWVRTTGHPGLFFSPVEQFSANVRQALAELRDYNAAPVPGFDRRLAAELQRLLAFSGTGGEPSERVRRSREQVARWILPYFVRADLLATRLERRFEAMSVGTFVMAAAAVAVVALQTIFAPELRAIVAIEVVLLLTLLGSLAISRRGRLLERWIAYRYLAERLRSATYIAVLGPVFGDRRSHQPTLYDPSELWMKRALDEIVSRCPRIEVDEADVPELREYLVACWIRDQIGYHRKHTHAQHTWDRVLMSAVAVLFGATLLAATLHTAGVGERSGEATTLGHLLVAVSICLPALGAAIHGVRSQAEFSRQSERSKRAAALLADLADQMSAADSILTLRDIAIRTERVMREENSDWFGVMRFHDMDLIT